MTAFLKFLCYMIVIGSTLLSISIAGGSYWLNQEFTKPGPLEQARIVSVPRGENIGGVSGILAEQDVISSAIIFEAMARFIGKAESIKAGEYQFRAGASMRQVLSQLTEGKTYARTITIREGLTNYEILNLLATKEDIAQIEISLLPEGRYLPETYSYALGDTNADILSRMANALNIALEEAWKNRADGLPIDTREEALTLASIIEKETSVAEERRTVAGVFINRLRMKMPLQTDPTVIYALTDGKPENKGKGPLGRRLLRADLQFDSPYNTYKYPGLPPGPIANPGKAAIEAALNPEEHNYLYFVADGTGGHLFATTLDEHNANVAKWRKIRAGQ